MPNESQCTALTVDYVQFGDYLKPRKQNCICHSEGIFEGFRNKRTLIHLGLHTHLATTSNGNQLNLHFFRMAKQHSGTKAN